MLDILISPLRHKKGQVQKGKEEDYYSILKAPKTALIEQQKALLAAEKVTAKLHSRGDQNDRQSGLSA